MFPQKSIRLLGLFLIAVTTGSVASQGDLFFDTRELTADQLITAVLARNPSIGAMRAAWQAAKQRVQHVSALDDPMLAYSFAPETRDVVGLDFGQKIQLSQKLPWPGKRALRKDGARFEAQVSEENLAILRLRLYEAANKIFADWYYIHEALRINGINQDLWKTFRSIAELKYSTGRASKQDALRAEVEQVMLEHQAIVLQRKQRDIRARINTLLNRVPDEALPPPATLSDGGNLPGVRQLREHALLIHPALKALDARFRASQAKQALAKRDYYPDFNVSAGYNSLWNQDEKRFTLGVGLNVPLGIGKRKARVRESGARVEQIQWQITDKQAEIAGAVQRAYDLVEEGRHVLTLYRKRLLPLADENLQAAQADYQSGTGNFLDLVSAEKNFFTTKLNHLQALANTHRHLAMLASRVGDPLVLNGKFSVSPAIHGDSQ